MTPFDLLSIALFAWYAAYCLVKTDGPLDVFKRLRAATTLGGLLLCMYCCICWTGLAGYLLFYHTPLQAIVYVGAIAGAGMILHRQTGGDHI